MLLQKYEHDTAELPPPYVEDDEYDVYLFYPSLSPRLLIPTNANEDTDIETTYNLVKPRHLDSVLPPYSLSSTTEVPQVSNDAVTVNGLDLEATTDLLSPLSPTWSFVSDFALPEGAAENVLNEFGYSRVFRNGLSSKSHQLTRRLGLVRRRLAKFMQFCKLKRSN